MEEKYSVRVLGNTSYANAETIREARRLLREARRLGMAAVIVRNTDNQVVD